MQDKAQDGQDESQDDQDEGQDGQDETQDGQDESQDSKTLKNLWFLKVFLAVASCSRPPTAQRARAQGEGREGVKTPSLRVKFLSFVKFC